MGYYIRVLATNPTPLDERDLRECLPSAPQTELVVESKDETGWSQVMLRHVAGPEIAVIERNPVLHGELGEAEIKEFIEEVRHGKPDSAARWLEQYLPRVKTIYAFQLLHGTDINDGWSAVHTLQRHIWNTRDGILQADGEGFSNEDGYTILWQFADDATGDWNLAVLDDSGRWVSFEMDLGNREQRAAFVQGVLPKGVKVLQ